MTVRTKYADPDFRPKPKTDHHCFICSRDLRPGRPFRLIRVDMATMEAVHPDDWAQAPGTEERPIGPDCAERFGLEWSRAG